MGAAVPWPVIAPRQRFPAPVMPWSTLTLRTAPCTTSLPLPCTAVSLCNTYRLAEHCNFVSAMPSFTMLEDPGASAAQLGSQLDLHGEDHAPAQAQHIKAQCPTVTFVRMFAQNQRTFGAGFPAARPLSLPCPAGPADRTRTAPARHPAGSAFQRDGERLTSACFDPPAPRQPAHFLTAGLPGRSPTRPMTELLIRSGLYGRRRAPHSKRGLT